MRTALYARVSTADKGQDPELQLRELREYCARRGWEVHSEYVDIGISGSKDSRPELNRLMADANRRRFDVVTVWKFDRFARSTSHLLRALETFQSLRINFVSLTEGIDTSTPVGKMVFTILGAVAEMERELIRERVRDIVNGNPHAKAKRTMEQFHMRKKAAMRWAAALFVSGLFEMSYGFRDVLKRPGHPTAFWYRVDSTVEEWRIFICALADTVREDREEHFSETSGMNGFRVSLAWRVDHLRAQAGLPPVNAKFLAWCADVGIIRKTSKDQVVDRKRTDREVLVLGERDAAEERQKRAYDRAYDR